MLSEQIVLSPSILNLIHCVKTISRIPAISDNTAQPNLEGNEHFGSFLIQNEQENHCQISQTSPSEPTQSRRKEQAAMVIKKDREINYATHENQSLAIILL